MKSFITLMLTKIKMSYIRHFLWKPLIKKSHIPQDVQEALLMNILNENKATTFGTTHGFSKITSYSDFKSNVAVTDYETLRPYIEKQETEKKPHLNPHMPVMYAQTSGTSGEPKLVPILNSTISQYRRSQHIVAYSIYAKFPEAFNGKVLAITSPAVEGTTKSGTDFGAMSGLIYQSMPSVMQSKYVLPARVFEIRDYDKKYYEIAELALAEKNISMIATANPSTMVKLDQIINSNQQKLIKVIGQKDGRRARELQKLLTEQGELVFRDIWPNLKSVTTWTGGNCAVQIPNLRKRMPADIRFIELGYLASEFRGAITIDATNNRQIPCIHENFYEFVEKSNWENGIRNFVRLTEIEPGKLYYIFVTTQNGLYRYDINDIIKVTGYFNKTPTIQFVQKGKNVTNLTGEKLYEGQLTQAISDIVKNHHVDIPYFKMLGCSETLRYTLYVENDRFDIKEFEARLSNLNIEFDAKRKSDRLKPTRLVLVKQGTGEAYKKHCLALGQREGQFKMSYLQNRDDCSFEFAPYVSDGNDAAN